MTSLFSNYGGVVSTKHEAQAQILDMLQTWRPKSKSMRKKEIKRGK